MNTAALTITANDASKTYGAALPALTYSDAGLVNGDTASVFSGALATPATAASGVGNYAITQGSLSAGADYTIGFTSGTLTVNTAALTITANDASKTYGAALPAFTASYSGLVNGDTSSVVSGLSLSTTATAASNAGTYAITPGGATASNYAIAYTSGTLTVNTAALTITANSPSKTYGAALPALTYSDAGLVNGDTASVFSAPSRHRQRPPPASATTPSRRARSRRVRDYTIGFTSGTLTVNTAALTITANDASKTYGRDC